MADVKWIKIVTDIFDDEKILLIESAPDADAVIVIWFKLLCLAGKQNNQGVFMMANRIAYTDEMLATIFRRPVNTIRMALGIFESYGMIEIINGVITIPNWEKHQSLDALEQRKEYMKGYMKEYREKQKLLCADSDAECKANSKVNSKVNVNEADKNREDKIRIDESINTDFGRFWAAYPKKVGKGEALKSFKKVKEPVDTLITAIEKQKKSVQWTKDNGRYIPNPATWLNQGRWEDELEQVDRVKTRDIPVNELPEVRRPSLHE